MDVEEAMKVANEQLALIDAGELATPQAKQRAAAIITLAAEVRRLSGAVTAGGAALIAAERERQVSVEGWTPEHDDEHGDGQLAMAAAAYAHPVTTWPNRVPDSWPWESAWWKPTPDNRMRELVKAGAMIAAEIDRLQRLEAAEAARRKA